MARVTRKTDHTVAKALGKRVRELGTVHAVLRKPIDINELSAHMKSCAVAEKGVAS